MPQAEISMYVKVCFLVLFSFLFFSFFFFFFVFLGPHMQNMEVNRLGVELEQELPAYARATWNP